LLYSLKHYGGDERIKSFIYDLVRGSDHSSNTDHKNHHGLAAPVPRGRKGKKKPPKETQDEEFEAELAKLDIDPEEIIHDDGYKKHLKRHANK
jgi:hypothetical protein